MRLFRKLFVSILSRSSLNRTGQVALSLSFLMGGIIVLAASTLALIAIAFLNASIGFQNLNRAYAVASGGIYDALLQISRNKDFSNSGYCVPNASPPCGSGSATVSVAQNSPSAGMATIVSESSVSRYKRKVQAVVSIATSTGRSVLVSWSLLSL